MKLMILALALAASTALIVPTASAQGAETESRSVRVSDLNLSTDNGEAQLDRRIARAADRICGGHYPGRLTLTEFRLYGECLTRTIASADGQVEVAIAAHERDSAEGG